MTKRIGIVGGGQLGRFLALAAQALGYRVTVLDPTVDCPASQVADEHMLGDFKDAIAIRRLAEETNYLTFEIESANAQILADLTQEGICVAPSAASLNIIKDKFKQKEFLRAFDIPVADFRKIDSKADIVKGAERFGYPLLLKARMDAYDGRGNALIKGPAEIDAALEKLSGRDLYIEKFVPFVKEMAVNVARSISGETVTHPLVETIHKNNICHVVKVGDIFDQETKDKAYAIAIRVMDCLKGAGLFTVEMFLTKDGSVVVNEIAPRVHNSGHYTLEGCHTSQFEQHIRAITGMPLGETTLKYPAAVMINILGERSGAAEPQGIEEAVALGNIHVHIYGKKETRPERKMGHLTAVGATLDEAWEKALAARDKISI